MVACCDLGKNTWGRRGLSHGDGASTFWAPQDDVLGHYQKTY